MDAEGRYWEAKTFQASLIRAFAFLTPILVSIVTGVSVGAALPPPESRTGTVVWWLSVFVASTAGLIAADRLTRRLLPLATLLRLSMVFPDRAPSRVKMARRVTGSRAIAHELEKAGRAGMDGDRQQAAETILALVGALGDYDSRTRGHSERTQLFVTLLADQLKLNKEDKGKLMWAALVHDIGKLRVPHEVLNKPGKPDEHEWQILQSHPHQGALICEPLKQWMGEWWLAIEQHHEKYDGSGYPRGLAGAQISYGARIVTVADSYEVMTASRPYKRPMTAAAAREELTRCAGSHFDPDVVRAFLNISLGRMHRSAGPIAWVLQLLAVRPGPILGQIIGGAAAVAGAAATALGLQLAPSWSSTPPDDTTIVAPPVDEAPVDEPQKPGTDGPEKERPSRDRTQPSAPVFIPPEPIVPIGALPPPATPPESEQPTAPEPRPEPTRPEPTDPEPKPAVPASLRSDALRVDEDTSGSVDVIANDEPGDAGPLTLVGASGALNGAVATSGSSVTYTPTKDFHGLDSVTYTARTPDGTVLTGSVAITVTPVNDAPVAVGDAATVVEDSSGNMVNVLANDTDVDGDVLRVTGIGTASHGSVSLASGVVTYSPSKDYSGSDSFSYTIADPDGLSASATVSVTVGAVNDPPVAVDDVLTILEDAEATVLDLLGNDSDVDGDSLTVTAVTAVPGAANGAIAEPSAGVWTYKPNPNFHGTVTLTYTVSDGKGGTDQGSMVITVTSVNDPPVAVDDIVTVAEDSGAKILNLTDNDTDVDGSDTLAVVSATDPAGGSVVVDGGGVWTYTPDKDFFGTDLFDYTVSDGNGGTDVGTVTVTVTAVDDDPVAVNDTPATDEDVAMLLTGPLLANDYDPDDPARSTPLTVTSVTITSGTPKGVVTEPTAGQFWYTPFEDEFGTEMLSYTIEDSTGRTATATVTLTIKPVNDAPSAAPDAYVTAPGVLTVSKAAGLLSNDSDVEGSALLVTAVRLISGPGPVFDLTSTWNDDGSFTTLSLTTGTYVLEYDVSDGTATSTGSLTITVSAASSARELYFQPGAPTEITGVMGVDPAPAANPGPGPRDYDGDGRPGLTIRSGGEKESETDPTKYHQWLYTVPAGGLSLNGPISMTLWTNLENHATQDLDYSGFLYECDGAGANCSKFAETVDIHVDDWNVAAGFEEQTVTIGSATKTIAEGRTLKLRVGFNHKDVWLAMDAERPSRLNLTLG